MKCPLEPGCGNQRRARQNNANREKRLQNGTEQCGRRLLSHLLAHVTENSLNLGVSPVLQKCCQSSGPCSIHTSCHHICQLEDCRRSIPSFRQRCHQAPPRSDVIQEDHANTSEATPSFRENPGALDRSCSIRSASSARTNPSEIRKCVDTQRICAFLSSSLCCQVLKICLAWI